MLCNGSELFGEPKVPNLGIQTAVQQDIRTLDVAVGHLPKRVNEHEGEGAEA